MPKMRIQMEAKLYILPISLSLNSDYSLLVRVHSTIPHFSLFFFFLLLLMPWLLFLSVLRSQTCAGIYICIYIYVYMCLCNIHIYVHFLTLKYEHTLMCEHILSHSAKNTITLVYITSRNDIKFTTSVYLICWLDHPEFLPSVGGSWNWA